MSSDPPAGWSWRRWTFWTGLVLALHAGLLLVIRPAPRSASMGTKEIPARVIPERPNLPDAVERLADPTLLALPHDHDFSAAAWLRPQAPPHRFAEWSEPARWLAANGSQLGRSTTDAAGQPAYDPPALDLPAPATLPVTPPAPLVRPSALRVEGELSAAPPAVLPVLPPIIATNLVTNSVVHVLANQAGHVLTARLLSADQARPREQAEADDLALKIGRSLRFSPAPAGSRQGRLIFQWSVRPPVPPAGTNP